MQPHQQRVVDELKELEERLDKLHTFITSDNFDAIVNDADECQRLVWQRNCMHQYAMVLQDRISNFK